MGVFGLWGLLQPASRPITLESLEGKVLAIDTSVWLHQALKSGSEVPNAHLVVLFHRLCKLLLFRIKPVFVFDGKPPSLKLDTLEKRRRSRINAETSAERLREQLLENFMKQRAVKTVLGSRKSRVPMSEDAVLFQIPEPDRPDFSPIQEEDDEAEDGLNFEDADLEKVDVDSEDFRGLPLEIQHEVLREMLERGRNARYRPEQLASLPSHASEFSQTQFQRLMRRGKLNQRLDSVRAAMMERQTAEVATRLMGSCSRGEVVSRRIVSQDEGHTLLIKMTQELLPQTRDATNAESSSVAPKEIPVTSDREPDISADWIEVLDALSDEEDVAEIDWSRVGHCSSKLVTGGDNVRWEPLLSEDDKGKESESDDEFVEVPDLPLMERFEEQGRRRNEAEREEEVEEKKEKKEKKKEEEGEERKEEEVEEEIEEIKEKKEEQEREERKEEEEKKEKKEKKEEEGEERKEEEEEEEIKERKEKKEEEEGEEKKGFVVEAKGVQEFERTENEEELDLELKRIMQQTEEKPKMEEGTAASSSQFSAEDLQDIASRPREWLREMEMEEAELRGQKRRETAAATKLHDEMFKEAEELLQLFGVPFVRSPEEAEAQCAELERLGLVQGSVTEDSDVWLFGGRLVIKNLFRANATPEEYSAERFEATLGLDRDRLVNVALLCGSDYTPGIKGVGPVLAMEIMAEFPGQGLMPLQDLKTWKDRTNSQDLRLQQHPVRKKIAKLDLPADFPSEIVARAYLEPNVDDSKETFTWGTPDLDLLRTFAKERLGWAQEKLDKFLLPVLKKMQNKQRQLLLNFTQIPSESRASGRIQRAVRKMRGEEAEPGPAAPKRSRSARPTPSSPQGRRRGRGRNERRVRGTGRGRRDGGTRRVVEHLALSEESDAEMESDEEVNAFMLSVDTSQL